MVIVEINGMKSITCAVDIKICFFSLTGLPVLNIALISHLTFIVQKTATLGQKDQKNVRGQP